MSLLLAGPTCCSSCTLPCSVSSFSSPRCCVTTCFATTAPSWRRRNLSSLWPSALPTSCASRPKVSMATTAHCRPGAAWRRRPAARSTASASKAPCTPWATAAASRRTATPARAPQPSPSTSRSHSWLSLWWLAAGDWRHLMRGVIFRVLCQGGICLMWALGRCISAASASSNAESPKSFVVNAQSKNTEVCTNQMFQHIILHYLGEYCFYNVLMSFK